MISRFTQLSLSVSATDFKKSQSIFQIAGLLYGIYTDLLSQPRKRAEDTVERFFVGTEIFPFRPWFIPGSFCCALLLTRPVEYDRINTYP